MEEIQNRIMAIDFGLKRIGLALSDPLFTFAYPYKTIANDHLVWDNINSIIKEMNVFKIVLGYPLKEDKSKTHVTDSVIKFGNKIKSKYKMDVILWDESYTSEMAKEIIVKSVSKKSKRRDKGLLDRNSAAIILQEYLDENRINKKNALNN